MSTDDVIQSMFKAVKNVRWRDYDERFKWYYAEDCHYVVMSEKIGAIWLVKAKSPASACEHVLSLIKEGDQPKG